MKIPRWARWTLGIGGGLALLLGGGFAWMASRLAPTVPAAAMLPAAVLTGLDGQPVDLASFRGRPLFLDFWRST